MNQDKKSNFQGGMLLIIIMSSIILGSWAIQTNILKLPTNVINSEAIKGIFKNEYLIRSSYCILLPALLWMMPSIDNKDKIKDEDKSFYFLMLFMLTAMVIYGFSTKIIYYNYLYPLIFIIHIRITARAMSLFKSKLEVTDILSGVSNITKDLNLDETYVFNTDKGVARIHNPYQGIMIEGAPGCGKSASLIEPMIYQAILKGNAAIVYDFKGNPPVLGLTAFNSIFEASRLGIKTPEFGLITFVDLINSVRVNPVSPKYITSFLEVKEATDVFMKSLNKEWIEKTDFFATTAIGYVQAIMWRLAKDEKYHHLCTLPHIITIILTDYNKVLNWLAEDPDTERKAQAIIVPHKNNAGEQLAGSIASAQASITSMDDRNIFWVLSPDEKEMFSLDINILEDPKILTISNDNDKKEALSPLISLIINTIKQKINQQGKHPCAFVIDEAPTCYIKELDQLPATGRSNKISTIIALQDRAQLIRMYGEKIANVILSTLGNLFIGRTVNVKTAKAACDMIGKNDIKRVSYNTSSENLSSTDSLQFQEVLQNRDVMGQKAGEFIGTIAAGEPPFFSAKFEYFDKKKIFKELKGYDDLPKFGLDYIDLKLNIQNSKIPIEVLKEKIFHQMVEYNYNNIINQIDELFENY